MSLTGQPKGPEHYGAGLSSLMIPGAALGCVVYVDPFNYAAGNNGFDAQHPLETIAAALALCTVSYTHLTLPTILLV